MKLCLTPTPLTTWKRLIIYCVSFIAAFFTNVVFDLACGPEPDPYDYYITFFHNNIQKTNDYWPFYFNGYAVLNDDQPTVSESEVNAQEWASYLGSSVKQDDVEHAMYKLSDTVESALYNKYLVRSKLHDSLRNNTFLKSLISKSNRPALLYYLFSQGLEHVTKNKGDRWNPEPLDSVALRNKAKEALNFAEKEHDSFLKLRYYYQTQRMLHYSGDMKAALKVYKKHFAKLHSNSHVMGWALSLKAGEEQRLGHDVFAAYRFQKYLRIILSAGCRRISVLMAECPTKKDITPSKKQ